MSTLRWLGPSEGYTGLFVNPVEEWSQFFTPCNWRTFHPIHFEVEDDRIMGGLEATIIVLGVGLRVRWNYARTEQVDEIKRRVDDLLATLTPTERRPNPNPDESSD